MLWNGLGDFSDNLVVWWVMMFMEVAVGGHCGGWGLSEVTVDHYGKLGGIIGAMRYCARLSSLQLAADPG